MKKTYEKPILSKGAQLQAIAAYSCGSNEPCWSTVCRPPAQGRWADRDDRSRCLDPARANTVRRLAPPKYSEADPPRLPIPVL